MQPLIRYQLDHSLGTVQLTLYKDRLTVKTQGGGVVDRPRKVDLELSVLEHFCLVPVIGIQRLQNFKSSGDQRYNAEFVFSFRAKGQLKISRVFVNAEDPLFGRFLDALERSSLDLNPAASLMHLDPAAALKKIGARSASGTVRLLLAVFIGVPVLLAIIFIIYKITGS